MSRTNSAAAPTRAAWTPEEWAAQVRAAAEADGFSAEAADRIVSVFAELDDAVRQILAGVDAVAAGIQENGRRLHELEQQLDASEAAR